jgi:3-oxosteroid 1-dehydrogenase
MTEQLKDRYDVVIVGSGAAGLVAAITAAKLGLSAVVIEKAKTWGGTSSLSGGVMWIPSNQFMAKDGRPDSYEETMGYLKGAIGDAGPATSEKRQTAFVRAAPRMLRMIVDEGAAIIPQKQPDYLAHLPHARTDRSVEPAIVDGTKLGAALETLRRYPGNLPAVRISEMADIGQGISTFNGIKTMLKVGARDKLMKLAGKKPLGMGTALVAELMRIVQRLGVPVISSCRLEDLMVEADRVIGVVCYQEGVGRRTVSAQSVLLSAGGFAHSPHRSDIQGMVGTFSMASPDDTGDMLALAKRIGADVDLLDSAWWGCILRYPDGTLGVAMTERSAPGSIIVNERGKRFTNEAQNYNLVGGILRTQKDRSAWLIIDSRHRRKYRFGYMLPGITPKAMFELGFFKKASTIKDLARLCGIDPIGLSETVARFNRFAETGVDEEFHRGENAYERYWGDPGQKPNPNLGPIDRPPFLAAKVHCGDIGTRGGFLTDANGRVLRSGKPMDGLYATGNCAATIFGRDYPGAGATLGSAMTFALLAIEHTARSNSARSINA